MIVVPYIFIGIALIIMGMTLFRDEEFDFVKFAGWFCAMMWCLNVVWMS